MNKFARVPHAVDCMSMCYDGLAGTGDTIYDFAIEGDTTGGHRAVCKYCGAKSEKIERGELLALARQTHKTS